MPTGSENELLAVLHGRSRAARGTGALRFLLDTMVVGPAPAELVFSALQLQVALQHRTAEWQKTGACSALLAPAGSSAGWPRPQG